MTYELKVSGQPFKCQLQVWFTLSITWTHASSCGIFWVKNNFHLRQFITWLDETNSPDTLEFQTNEQFYTLRDQAQDHFHTDLMSDPLTDPMTTSYYTCGWLPTPCLTPQSTPWLPSWQTKIMMLGQFRTPLMFLFLFTNNKIKLLSDIRFKILSHLIC